MRCAEVRQPVRTCSNQIQLHSALFCCVVLCPSGGTAAAGACLYYLWREEAGESKEGDGEPKKINSSEATKEQVMTILRGILKSQEKTKALMKEFIKDMIDEDLT